MELVKVGEDQNLLLEIRATLLAASQVTNNLSIAITKLEQETSTLKDRSSSAERCFLLLEQRTKILESQESAIIASGKAVMDIGYRLDTLEKMAQDATDQRKKYADRQWGLIVVLIGTLLTFGLKDVWWPSQQKAPQKAQQTISIGTPPYSN